MPKPLGLEWLQNNVYFSIPGLGPNGFNFTFSSNVYWYYIIVLLCLLHDLRGRASTTRVSAARGPRCARTRSPPHRWASTSCGAKL